MLGSFLDKATGLLDRLFIIAYWFPVFIVSVIAILIKVYVYGWEAALGWWQQSWMLKGQESGFYAQIWIIVGTLIIISVLAYMLQPFTRPIIKFYEGYWPLDLQRWFINFPVLGMKNNWEKKSKQQECILEKIDCILEKIQQCRVDENKDLEKYNQLQVQYNQLQIQCNQLQILLFYGYPPNENRLMPTRLGNALRAAEDYPRTVYGMDSLFWWPRLWPLLPDVVRNEVNESMVPIVTLLNLASLTAVVAILGSLYFIFENLSWQALFLSFGGLLLALISYRAAVSQAINYGENIRMAIDLYRFNLLKALHQPLPKTLDEEIKLWDRLLLWIYTGDRGSVVDMKYNYYESSSTD